MIAAHGGQLINRYVSMEERADWLARTRHAPTFMISQMTQSDLDCIASGIYSPLTGFVRQKDYQSICEQMRLANGLVWSIPISLPIPEEYERSFAHAQYIVLLSEMGERVAVVEVEEIYRVDQRAEAIAIFGTDDPSHPGVMRLSQQSSLYLGGDIWCLQKPTLHSFADYHLYPAETRVYFQHCGWKSIVGFQTRNPIHRAHEYIQKAALEMVDALFINPLVGTTKTDDLSAEIRMKSYQAILQNYYPLDRVLMAVFPASMRYAGPREAIVHALARKNYGCTHFIVGRDHAGVGNFYGTYDAQKIFSHFTSEEIGIMPLFFEHSFYCRRCDGMASYKTCPHDKADHLILSGSKVREMLSNGELPPPEFSRPEVVKVLIEGLKEERNRS
ncbi:sulfate adenylyltransferase [Seinonella peptonophila]|uniref:Sulfate adenylyltransferase n=1 Tax=Seinonella peptonophila TaxID=112248 RepID=A0A1M4W5H6_9BACL|nr:sulfate adenylyltransferase [Seinonella peptonophila]SHE76459.1 sulfate adenylyltransferase [Seinonella peptonophila]